MSGELMRVLITVKAYPNPSKKYQKTVCVAGIDIDENRWIRLYPIPFRDLDQSKMFKKYNIIKAKVFKANDDRRPESYKVDINSIRIEDHLDTKDKWRRRKSIVLKIVDKSMCEILKKKDTENKSLGVFKPNDIRFSIEKAPPIDEEDRKSCYAQLHLFNKKNVRRVS